MTSLLQETGAQAVRLRATYQSIRSSLFWTPFVYVVAAVALVAVATWADAGGRLRDQPWLFAASADGARTVLQAVATATITVAGLVFPVTVVALQLASSQFSPRVLRGFLRDRILQHVLGAVVGTFVFAILALAVNAGQGSGRDEPGVSLTMTLATVLSVVAVVAIVAFIHHAARYMQVVEIIKRATQETQARIASLAPDPAGEGEPEVAGLGPPEGTPVFVRSLHDGWVQQVDAPTLIQSLPKGATARADVRAGVFVTEGQPLASIWLDGNADEADEETVINQAREAFAIGATRTMQQDIAYGIRQIVDIALRALSPAINDPTTAAEVTANLGAILRDLLARDLPPRVIRDEDGRTILRPHELLHEDYVAHAFDQLRLAAAPHPQAAIRLLETIANLTAQLKDEGLDERTEPLLAQVDLILQAVEREQPLPHDLERVRRMARELRPVVPPAGPAAPVRPENGGAVAEGGA